MKQWFAALGSLITFASRADPIKKGYAPFADKSANLLYNLLFCDKPELFKAEAGDGAPHWSVLLADEPYVAGLRAIAEDHTRESRLRALAYFRLRQMQQSVPRGDYLGTIVELGMNEGVDVLALYIDRRVRYINHSGKIAAFDPALKQWASPVNRLIEASQNTIESIGPWTQPRVAPPKPGMIRMSFLVSDGLYFGEGPMAVMEKEVLAKAIISASIELLKAIAAHGASATPDKP